MPEKIVLTSSSMDSHGITISREMLLDAVVSVNAPYKMRYLVNHKREYPLLGFLDDAELIRKDEVDLVVAQPIFYTSQESVTWDENLLLERPIYPVKLKMRGENVASFVVTLDPNNFKTTQDYFRTVSDIQNATSEVLKVKTDMRKNQIPEPRLIISLAAYYTVLHPFVKPFLKKMGEKMAEDFGADIYEGTKENLKMLAANIRHVVTLTRKNTIPQNKTLMVIFEIPGMPYIELHARTDNADLIATGLSPYQLAKMHIRLNQLGQNVEIAEAHFNLTERGSWIFTYLLTPEGIQIGTKTIFKKRDKLIRRIKLSPTYGHSIGADVIYECKQNG